jgi:kinesin family protein 11
LERADKAAFTVVECRCEHKEVSVTQTIPGKKLSDAQEKTYTFDHVFDEYVDQVGVFDRVARPVVDEVVQGFNCTIFAYGQTGTGKTFTIEGALPAAGSQLSANAGIIPRSVGAIFSHLSSGSREYSVRVSYLEIYNEELVDLLADDKPQLRIYEDGKMGVSVERLREVPVPNVASALEIMEKAQKKKQVSETQMNKHSSRSHCIFTISIHRRSYSRIARRRLSSRGSYISST